MRVYYNCDDFDRGPSPDGFADVVIFMCFTTRTLCAQTNNIVIFTKTTRFTFDTWTQYTCAMRMYSYTLILDRMCIRKLYTKEKKNADKNVCVVWKFDHRIVNLKHERNISNKYSVVHAWLRDFGSARIYLLILVYVWCVFKKFIFIFPVTIFPCIRSARMISTWVTFRQQIVSSRYFIWHAYLDFPISCLELNSK